MGRDCTADAGSRAIAARRFAARGGAVANPRRRRYVRAANCPAATHLVTDLDLKQDCRHVRWDRPCAPHKLRGKVCRTCDEYDPVRRRVLVVKLAATGDVLRTTAFLPAIHAAWPPAHVTWLTRRAAAGLFAGNPLVDDVLTTDDAVTTARLQTEEFDVVLCPDADPEAAALAAMARGRERRGYVRDAHGRVVPLGEGALRWLRMGVDDGEKRRNTETYQSLVARVLELPPEGVREPILVPSRADVAAADALVRSFGVQVPLVGLNTGAGGRWAYKQWTFAHQSAFLRLATDAGLAVMLLGGPEEVQRHRDLLAAGARRAVFDGGNDNPFGRFAALVECCAVVVTSDSLAVHVAAARKVPAVVLFGPTSAAEIELYGRGTKIVPKDLDCLCCYLPRCDRVPHCQALIEPETVLAAVQHWLQGAPR
jgi:heptosyltransferase-2